MAQYKTQQRKILCDFLKTEGGRGLTARQIADGVKGISLSAVYRNLSSLEGEGKLHRYTKEGSREVYYRFVGGEHCREHLHLACKKCGKTFHMNHTDTERLLRSIEESGMFSVDRADSVLNGICRDCKVAK